MWVLASLSLLISLLNFRNKNFDTLIIFLFSEFLYPNYYRLPMEKNILEVIT